jgi:hypothetical protein
VYVLTLSAAAAGPTACQFGEEVKRGRMCFSVGEGVGRGDDAKEDCGYGEVAMDTNGEPSDGAKDRERKLKAWWDDMIQDHLKWPVEWFIPHL